MSPWQQIAQQLGVKNILEGGVQRAGDRVRVTVQLIDAATDGHVSTEGYDRELIAANIFAIQSELAAAIAAALETTLTAAEKARATSSQRGISQPGRHFSSAGNGWPMPTAKAFSDAEDFFQQAIDLDPKFALAYVGLSDSLTLADRLHAAHRRKESPPGPSSGRDALEFDPNWPRRGPPRH